MRTSKEAINTIGKSAVLYEQNLYNFLGKHCEGYKGGKFYWTRIQGCFYLISYDEETTVRLSGNYLDTELPLSYAVLYANLMLTNQLCHYYYEKSEELCAYWSTAFHLMRGHCLDAWEEGKAEELFMQNIFILID
ncbi:hypothetical protein [Photobacterium lutimaris]|uniref:Antirestriction protein n=1 Tax=Photobacterium lutimaris TaxID=388278 RepID=A0A2T3J4K3_9GAMM|nr:hypothetical protein [Photobacterium lutimaris]PSU36208.1 hypothetical protein C9I99_04195 [Photobacterium lutimaris]